MKDRIEQWAAKYLYKINITQYQNAFGIEFVDMTISDMSFTTLLSLSKLIQTDKIIISAEDNKLYILINCN